MFSKIIDVVLGRTEQVGFPEHNDMSTAIIWLVWFSIMLYFSIGLI